MRSRNAIEKDGKRTDMLHTEILLDIRDLLEKQRKFLKKKPKKEA